jgi:serine protease Do
VIEVSPLGSAGRRRAALIVASAVVVVVAISATVLVLEHHSKAEAKGDPGRGVPSRTFAALYRYDANGVVSLDASTCSGSGIGSGFLVSPTLVATAAHVVDGAVAIGVSRGDVTTAGEVVGIDDGSDLALVRTRAPLTGHVFELSSSPARSGAEVGVIGYPESGPATLRLARIDRLGASIDAEGVARRGLVRTDASLEGSYSGGPLLLANGTLVGMAVAASGGVPADAVPAATAVPAVARWEAAAAPPPLPPCATPLGPAVAAPVRTLATGPDAIAISSTLTTYFHGIDAGQYPTAYAELGPDEMSSTPERQFAESHSSSYDYDVTLKSVSPDAAGSDRADVTFTSLQRASLGPNGDTCDHWTLDCTMIRTSGQWLLNAASGQGGIPSSTC